MTELKLDHLTVDDFRTNVGSIFAVSSDEGDAAFGSVVLAEVSELPSTRPQGREPFALVFVSESKDVWQQGTYGFKNESLGFQHIFVVPIGWCENGVRYQAVFN